MLGALVVSLGLDAADFISGMSKSDQQAKRFASSLERSIAGGIVKAEIAMRALGSAARTTFDVFQSLTIDAAEFKDLEETTGASAESLASLAVAAATAGVPMGGVADAVNKMTKSLVGVDDESKAAGAALKALGLDVKAFKELDPAAQYEALAKAFNSFADSGTSGAAKAATAQALLGKAGTEQLKVFKALEEQGGRQAILTQQQIEQADAFADAQAKAAKQLQLYAQAAASEAVPAFSTLTAAAADFAKELLGVDAATGQLKANNGVKEFAERAVDALAFIVDAGDGVVRTFNIIGKTIGAAAAQAALIASGEFRAAAQVGRDLAADVDSILQRQTLQGRIAARRAQGLSAGAPEPAAIKPGLAFNGPPDTAKASAAAADAAREQKRIMDGQIKAIRAFADEQKEAFDFANRFVKASYDDGLITLQQSFDSERQIREAALQSTIASLDAEVRVLQEHASKAAKPEVRIEAENKIAEAIARRSQAVQKAQQEGVFAAIEEGRAIAALQGRYEDLRATILELSGDTKGASSIRIAQQVADARKLLAQSGQDPGLADTLGQKLTDTERLRQAQSDYNGLIERARLSEESILLTARESGATELETLRAVGASRAVALQQMGAMVAEAQQLAALLDTDEARRYADGLAVAFQRAAMEVDPVLLKIRGIGEEITAAIVDPISDAIVEWKSWSDLIGRIERQLIAIATNELFTKPAGAFLSNLIGGNGAPSGGGGMLGNLLGTAGSSLLQKGIGSLFGAGPSVGGGIGIGGYGLPGSFGGLFAGGGDLAAGKWGIAGDAGPELIRGPAHVVPHNRSMRMLASAASDSAKAQPQPMVNNLNFTFAGPVTKKTLQQVYAEALRGIAQGRRGN